MGNILCLDIGGTSIKVGLYDQKGTIIAHLGSRPTEPEKQSILESVKGIIYETKENYSIQGIAISSAGVIDSQQGKVVYSGYTIPNYTGTELKKSLETEFKLPCEVENDVNSACLAEVFHGSGVGYDSVVCLTIGTGVGGAIALNQKLVHGTGFTAGEVGYMLVNEHYFQDIASTTFLIKRANELDSTQHYQDGKEIFDQAKEGNAYCRQAIDELVDNLATGLINIMYLLNPDVIILGGGIMSQKDYLNDRIKRRVSDKLISPLFGKTSIKFAQNENNAGMLGALYHFNQKNK